MLCRYQYDYKMKAMRGMGVDRHLFGLYIIAKGLKMDPMPKMFTDKVSFRVNFQYLDIADIATYLFYYSLMS